MTRTDYDLCVIGGGINGAGIARDAAGRGLSVLLVEAHDLASATSSSSTKLIHGGLRYLEYGEFKLVAHSLAERETLLSIAPHIIRPQEFILPHDSHLRPAWMISAGLFLYDHLGGKHSLAASHGVNLPRDQRGKALNDDYKKGFSYADAWVDDARLVVLNTMDAAERGADILTRASCTGIEVRDGLWHITLRDMADETSSVKAKMVVNAAGPWVRDVLQASNLTDEHTPHIRLVKGSHIVIPRLYEGSHAYILQQPDRRIIFAIPYEDNFTLIGTTETEFSGNPTQAALDTQEKNYLIAAVNRSFKTQITAAEIFWSYSGVRPLFDDGRKNARAVTRDYRLVLDHSHGPPILSVFGGKITTYRRLAYEVVDLLTGQESNWTATAPLPGGDIEGDFESFAAAQQARYPHLPPAIVHRYARAYGTRMDRFAGDDMGKDYGGGLYEAEVDYLIRHEWAKSAEDILWRRTKLGLHVGEETVYNLKQHSFFQV